MAISYPAGLPLGLKQGRSYQLVSPKQRSDLVSGRARQRRRFTNVPEGAQVAWIFSDAEATTFIAWWRDALIDGTQWFDMPLDTPLGLAPHACRFVDVYTGPSSIGPNHWSITAELELRERVAPPVGSGLFPDFLLNSSIFDIAVNQKWPNRN